MMLAIALWIVSAITARAVAPAQAVVRTLKTSVSPMGLINVRKEKSSPRRLEIAKLCKSFDWPVRPSKTPAPNIFYGIVTNGEDLPLLEAHIHQVYDFVHRFVVVDSRVTQAGFENPYPEIDYTSDSFLRFAPKLRNLTYTEQIYNQRFRGECQGHGAGGTKDCARQNGQRKMIADGFLNSETGVTELTEDDVVIVADIDEIPTREAMRALSDCGPPAFAAARVDYRAGKKPCVAGPKQDTKVILKSQYTYFHVDCPLRHVWYHPDATSAVCLLHGGWNPYDVRNKDGGVMSAPVAAFHLHNVGRSDKQLEFKYKTYGEPCSPSRDAICHPGNVPEMRKRMCDTSTPPLGPKNWSFEPLLGLYDLATEHAKPRGWLSGEIEGSWQSYLSIVADKPKQYAHFFWTPPSNSELIERPASERLIEWGKKEMPAHTEHAGMKYSELPDSYLSTLAKYKKDEVAFQDVLAYYRHSLAEKLS